MHNATRPLIRRSRAVQACTACRQTKSKCDGKHPSCDRCTRCNMACEYTQNSRDRRMDRQEERRAHVALANRVRELEAQLVSAKQPQGQDAISPSSYGGSVSSPAQPFSQQHGNGGSLNTEGAEPTADAIATGLFDDQPGNADIGYFGASSNHAFFWSLTSFLEELNKCSGRQNVPPRQVGANEGPRRLPLPPLRVAMAEPPQPQPQQPQEDSFPGRKTAIDWVNRFFDTVAPVLPLVNRSMLLREIDLIDSRTGTWQSCPCNTQALLGIVFAHALATAEDGAAEPFYRRSLGLLDERGLYLPTVEALQALLLLASYQQNSQRAQESITTHFRAVKAAYQLGVHSPSSYIRLANKDKELRSALWFAVINEDRIIGSGLGRPFLVPAQHVRPQLGDMLRGHGQDDDAKFRRSTVRYFRHVISFHEIMGRAVDTTHASNITSTHDLSLSDLLPHVMELLRQLEQLRQDATPHKLLVSNVTANAWLAADFDTQRHTVLLSLYYYRVAMLINAPLLLAALQHVSVEMADPPVHVSVAFSILHAYLRTLDDFHNLICTIMRIQRSFLRRNAVWWLCNYMMVSLNLHIFGFWLLSSHKTDSLPALGMTSTDIEGLMRRALDTLKLVGGSSIMSRKAHRCLQRYLDSFTNGGTGVGTRNVQVGVGSHVPVDAGPWPYALPDVSAMGVWDSSMDDLMMGLRAEDFLGEDMFAMSYSISDFDATGFI